MPEELLSAARVFDVRHSSQALRSASNLGSVWDRAPQRRHSDKHQREDGDSYRLRPIEKKPLVRGGLVYVLGSPSPSIEGALNL